MRVDTSLLGLRSSTLGAGGSRRWFDSSQALRGGRVEGEEGEWGGWWRDLGGREGGTKGEGSQWTSRARASRGAGGVVGVEEGRRERREMLDRVLWELGEGEGMEDFGEGDGLGLVLVEEEEEEEERGFR